MTTILFYAAGHPLLRTVAEAAAILHSRYGDALRVRMFARELLDDPQAGEQYLKAAAGADIAVLHLGGGDDRVPFADAFAAATASIPVVKAPRSGRVEVLNRSVEPEELDDLHAYLAYGGLDNTVALFERLMARFAGAPVTWSAPVELPWEGVYHPRLRGLATIDEYFATVHDPQRWTAAIWVHRSHAVSGNLEAVDELVAQIEAQGGNALPIFLVLVHAEERDNLSYQALIDRWLLRDGRSVPDVLINLMIMPFGFERRFTSDPRPEADDGLARLGIPVLKAVLSSISEEDWRESARGLSPMDLVTQFVYPEFAGQLNGTIVAFRDDSIYDPITDSYQTRYRPHPERINRLVAMARSWARLRRTPVAQRRVALVLHNYPPRDDTIASASGLDAPESALRLLRRMRAAGYDVGDLPEDSAGLMTLIRAAATNDHRWRDDDAMAEVAVTMIPIEDYRRWFTTLPAAFQARVLERWGPPEKAPVVAGGFPVTGVRFGNVLVTLQPVRAFGEDAASILHDPDVPVPHHYVAAYQWIRYGFGAHAAIHLGTHGSLEWLPGESIGLSADCDPDVTLGELPNLYPYIVNNPGEGTQAKRRGNAALIGHLPPAATNAGAYEELEALDQAIDDYREAVDLGSARAPAVAQRVWQLVQDAHLDQDLGIEESPVEARAVEDMVGRVDNYLGFLKEAQITTGLHVLGSGPQGDRLAEYLVALTRQPRIDRPSLRALALELAGLDLTSVLKEPGAVHRTADDRTVRGTSVLDCAQAWSLELMGAVAHHATSSVDDLVTAALDSDSSHRLRAARPVQHGVDEGSIRSALDVLVREVRDELLPLLSCDRELTSILDGLDGRRIEPGASGAPTAGEWSMLPAGRNFHSVNPLSLPSREAWAVGQQLAADLLERYRCDHGDYPAEIGFDLRGIPEMRTKGEDVAEVLALLGVRPVHESWSAEVRTVEVIPLADLRRPRIDVTVRMSGLFRDTFPNLIALLDEAVQAVAFLDEPEGMNFVAAHVLADVRELRTLGVPDRAAQRRASYRLFGGKPGAYGAGPERLVEEKAWETRGELGNIYIEYGGYAYTADEFGEPDVDGFVRQLRRVDAAVRNLDTREIDLLSCSCQYGHLGGMVAAVESVRGVQPVAYIGDSSDHARLTTRTLREEMKVQLCSLQSEVDREHAGTRLQGGGRDRREGRSIVRVGCHRGGDGRLDVRRSGRAVRTGRADQGVDGGGQPPRATEHHRAAARGAPARDVECLAGAHRRTAVPLPRIGGRRRGVGGAMTATRKAALRAMTASRPPVFPFSAIVGQEAMKLALILTVIDPGIGGVLVQGTKGTAKSTAVRALAAVLPPLRVVAGSWSNADPDDPHQGCGAQSSAPGRFDEDRASGEIELRPMSVVELPLGVTEDRVVGSLDIHATLQEGRQRFAPGLLAKANRNILYVDEVNLLDDHIVDVLLDAAAMGTNTVERDGISVTHAARFVLVGTMNPEEGDLRPQLIDRFGLSVDVGDICDPQQRLDVLDRRLAFDQDPVAFLADWDAPQRALADRIVRARQELPSVQVPRELKLDIARLSIELAVEGHRADLVLQRAAAASAAYADRQIAARSDARRVAPMVLRHRLRRMPFEDATQHHAKLERAVTTVLGDAG